MNSLVVLAFCLLLATAFSSPLPESAAYSTNNKGETFYATSADPGNNSGGAVYVSSGDPPNNTRVFASGSALATASTNPDDLNKQESVYPFGGVWWGMRPGWVGFRPGWNGWGNLRPGWNGWGNVRPGWNGWGGYRPQWGGQWGQG